MRFGTKLAILTTSIVLFSAIGISYFLMIKPFEFKMDFDKIQN